jgi:hypothetical protein
MTSSFGVGEFDNVEPVAPVTGPAATVSGWGGQLLPLAVDEGDYRRRLFSPGRDVWTA